MVGAQRACHLGHHTTVAAPEVGVTSGFTTAACARGDLFTVKPEVCPIPPTVRGPRRFFFPVEGRPHRRSFAAGVPTWKTPGAGHCVYYTSRQQAEDYNVPCMLTYIYSL